MEADLYIEPVVIKTLVQKQLSGGSLQKYIFNPDLGGLFRGLF